MYINSIARQWPLERIYTFLRSEGSGTLLIKLDSSKQITNTLEGYFKGG